MALGFGLGLFSAVALYYSLTSYSGTGPAPPPWVGPLSGLGEIGLVLVAPLCLLVALVAFILFLTGGNGPRTGERIEPNAPADRSRD